MCEHGELADRNPAAYAVIEAARQAHGKGMQSYLIFMAVRLLEMQRILNPTGSIYLHCDPTASHYLKLLMDGIFGKNSFRNEIIWSYCRWPSKSQNFQTMHDVILFYTGIAGHTFNVSYELPSESYLKRFKGKTQVLDTETRTRKIVVDKPTKGLPMRDVWDVSILAGSSKERLGYPTQKPLALLDRIIKASCNPGDMVSDPFCGCATALVAADRLGRQWAGIDLSPLAIKLVKERIIQDNPLWGGPKALDVPPQRTDLGHLPSSGRTVTASMGSRKASVRAVIPTSRFESWKLTISCLSHVVAQITPITCNFSVQAATAARAVRPWQSGGQADTLGKETILGCLASHIVNGCHRPPHSILALGAIFPVIFIHSTLFILFTLTFKLI